MNSEILIEFKNCEFQFENIKKITIKKNSIKEFPKVTILKNINLTLQKNRVYGIIGPNGSGKSTLLKLIFGLLQESKGGIVRNFKNGKLLDEPTFFHQELSAFDNFRAFYSLNVNKVFESSHFKEKEKFFKILTKLENIDLNKPVVNLSKGMKAKVGFGLTMSFLENIDLIGLDEFFSFGDDNYKLFSGKYIKNEIKKTGSAILVSHSLDLIRNMCDEVIHLNKGEIINQGHPEEVVKEYQKLIN